MTSSRAGVPKKRSFCSLVAACLLGAARASNRTLRCLHTEGMDQFFHLKDMTDLSLLASIFNASTLTQDDAINLTGLITGFNVDILETMAKRAGHTVEFYQLNGFPYATHIGLQDIWPQQLPMFDCDANSEIIVPIASASGTLDFMIPSVPSGFIVVGPIPKTAEAPFYEKFFTFMRPFHWTVWLTLVGALALSSAAMYWFEGCPGDGCLHFMYNSGVLFTGAGSHDPVQPSSKLFYMFMSFTVFLVVTAYTANLATLLIAERHQEQTITSIHSFDELGVKACCLDSHQSMLVERYPNIEFVPIPKSLGLVNLIKTAQAGVECAGAVSTDVHMKSALVEGSFCDMQLVGRTFTLTYYGIPFLRPPGGARNDLLWEYNQVFLDMLHGREVDDLIRSYFPPEPGEAAHCPKEEASVEGEGLTLIQVGGTFSMLIFGLLVSFVVKMFCWLESGRPVPRDSAPESAA